MKDLLNVFMETMRYKSDISITNDFAKKIFTIVLAAIAYIMTTSTICTIMSNTIIGDKVNSSRYGSITVEFFGSDGDVSGILTNKQKASVISILNALPGVKSAKSIDSKDVHSLVDKWMPGIEIPADLPLPTLFSVELSGFNSTSASEISDALSKINKNIRVYDHSTINNDIVKLNGMFKIISVFLSILSALMICAAVYYFTNSLAASNEHTLKVLRAIGASKDYIFKQFQSLNLSIGVKAIGYSSIGSIITCIMLHGILSPSSSLYFIFICTSITIIMAAILLAAIAYTSAFSAGAIHNDIY